MKMVQASMGIVFLLMMLAAAGLVFLNARRSGCIDFFFRKSRYEEIVKAVKALPLAPGETRLFQLDGKLNPVSLTPEEKAAGNRRLIGQLRAERASTGDYVIELITTDGGHAGFSGYTFWDKALKRNEAPPQPSHEPGHIYRRLNDHWCAFSNNEG